MPQNMVRITGRADDILDIARCRSRAGENGSGCWTCGSPRTGVPGRNRRLRTAGSLTCIKAGPARAASICSPDRRKTHERAVRSVPGASAPHPAGRIDRPWVWLAAGWRDLLAAPGQPGLRPGAGNRGMVRRYADAAGSICPISCCRSAPAFSSSVPSSRSASTRSVAGARPACLVDRDSMWLAWRRNPDQIALMGLLLFFHLAWMRLRSSCSRFSSGARASRGTASPISLWFSSRSLPFLGFGIACGAVLAAAAFAIGAFAMPYLLAPPQRQPVRGHRHFCRRRPAQPSADDAVGRR